MGNKFRVKSYGSDHKFARVSLHGARGVVGRGKSHFERYGSIPSLCFSSISFSLLYSLGAKDENFHAQKSDEDTDMLMI